VVVTGGVHQVCAGAAPRDAITHHLLESRRVIREMGLRSEILCEDDRIGPTLAGNVLRASTWDDVARPGDVAILHYSIGSPAFGHVLERCERVAIHYHNITPAELLWEDAPAVAIACLRGRRELASLAGRVAAAAADSRFNADELATLGFPDAAVVGVMRRELPVVPAPAGPRPPGGPLSLLFVGRGVPNKAQHHLIAALAALRQSGEEDARLHLIGSWVGMEAYAGRCARLARDLRVAEHVVVEGSVEDDRLARAYADCDAFVCLSDHEGYCVPLVEAMASGRPIVAFASSAVTETVGEAGLLLDEKPPSLVAEAVREAASNPRLAARMGEGRRERLAHLGAGAVASRVRAFVETLA
jgi:glycosyltransferase involved in cell wall biosynthesis